MRTKKGYFNRKNPGITMGKWGHIMVPRTKLGFKAHGGWDFHRRTIGRNTCWILICSNLWTFLIWQWHIAISWKNHLHWRVIDCNVSWLEGNHPQGGVPSLLRTEGRPPATCFLQSHGWNAVRLNTIVCGWHPCIFSQYLRLKTLGKNCTHPEG